METYSFLSETIHAYTGLSLAAFVTILSLMIGAYFLVSSLFVHPESIAATEKSAVATPTPPVADQTQSPPPALLAQPVQMGEMTLEELKEYNGSDRNKPLLVSIKGDVYDVSRGCSISDITTEPPIEICNASPVSAAELGSLMRRLATAIQYSRSVLEKGGYYGDKEQEMDKFENGVKVDLKAMSLRKLKAMELRDPNYVVSFSENFDQCKFLSEILLSRLFYGPGGAYHFFSGNEISRALALMSFDPNDFTDNLDGLGSNELEVLSDWIEKFKERYVKVGRVVRRGENETSEPESSTTDVANVGADAGDE